MKMIGEEESIKILKDHCFSVKKKDMSRSPVYNQTHDGTTSLWKIYDLIKKIKPGAFQLQVYDGMNGSPCQLMGIEDDVCEVAYAIRMVDLNDRIVAYYLSTWKGWLYRKCYNVDGFIMLNVIILSVCIGIQVGRNLEK